MRKIDLDELYVEHYYSKYCEPYECYGMEIDTDGAKPLREHIQEYLDLDVVDDKTYFSENENWPWSNDITNPDEHQFLQDIMDGKITEYGSTDRGCDELPSIWVYTDNEYEYQEHHLTPLKETIEYNKKVKSDWAREEGTRPKECWYRKNEVVYSSADEYPF